jgi:hypothetical protein
MEELIKSKEEISKDLKPYSTNPKYHALTMRLHRLKRKLEKTSESILRMEMLKQLRALTTLRRRMKSTLPNVDNIRIKYVRYADD